eukprot:6097419-Amphidinium_carterae.3
MSLYDNPIIGETRSSTTRMQQVPDFNKGTKTVEEYYRNVYIDNKFTSNTHAMKGKCNKGKGKYGKEGQERYTDYTGGKKGSTTPYTGPTAKEKGSTNHDPTTSKGRVHIYHNTGSYGSCNNC